MPVEIKFKDLIVFFQRRIHGIHIVTINQWFSYLATGATMLDAKAVIGSAELLLFYKLPDFRTIDLNEVYACWQVSNIYLYLWRVVVMGKSRPTENDRINLSVTSIDLIGAASGLQYGFKVDLLQ